MMAKQAIANFSDMLLIPLSRFEMETIPTQIGRPCVGSSLTCSRRGGGNSRVCRSVGRSLSRTGWRLLGDGFHALVRGIRDGSWQSVLAPASPSAKAMADDLGRLALNSRGAFGRLWGMVFPKHPCTKALLMRAAAHLL